VAHWPKSFIGNIFGLVLILIAALALVQSAIALSGPFVWMALAFVTLTSVAVSVWHRRARIASDLALADAPSFGDVLPHWNHTNDLEPQTR
jgi:hypothetical protein